VQQAIIAYLDLLVKLESHLMSTLGRRERIEGERLYQQGT
jgi:hypothetical protein